MQILTIDYHAATAPQQLTESLKNTGFAVIKHHPIDYALIQAVYGEWEKFFASAEKFNYVYDKEKAAASLAQDGYFPFRSENAKDAPVKDLKEFYHLYPWGQYPAMLSGKTRELFTQLSGLASTLLQWLEENTPAEIKAHFSMPLSQMIADSPRTLLRILNYPPLSGKEDPNAVRAAAHEDIDLLTLLPASTATGLQAKDLKGNWHAIECGPDMIVVNAGDMLQLCSNHYYRSTTHQVVNPTGDAAKKPRLSMPLFLHARDEVVLSETHTARSYLLERLRELGVI